MDDERWAYLESVMLESVPPDFYYDAWGSEFVQAGEKSDGYMGGLPQITSDHDWPSCDVHGALLHLWSAKDAITGDTIQHFVCAGLDKDAIEVNYHCEGDLSCIGFLEMGCFARRIGKDTFTREAPPSMGFVLPQRDFKWVPVHLLDRRRIEVQPMEFNSFFDLGDGRFMHSDTVCDLESEEDSHVQRDHFLLHRCRGLPIQHPEGLGRFGYFVTVDYGGGARFSPYNNRAHLHMNFDLIMKWAQ